VARDVRRIRARRDRYRRPDLAQLAPQHLRVEWQWLASVKRHIKVSRRKADIPHDQRAAGRPAMTRIVKTIAAKLGVKTAAIQDEHGGRWRELAAWLGVPEGMRRLRVIAQTLRLRSCSRVTQRVRSCDRRLRTTQSGADSCRRFNSRSPDIRAARAISRPETKRQ
jgi:hypothetical protein